MDKDLAKGPIGSVGQYDVAFSGGKLMAVANVSLPPSESIKLSVEVDAGKVLDALANAIPGVLDNALIALIKSGLGI
jgi:hypothetical protein